MARKDVLGRTGEQLAVEHLAASGYTIIDRNWRCVIGEIDIVARQGDTTVVVEVKTRSGIGYGHPLDAVTPRKLARLRRLAAAWCAAHPVHPVHTAHPVHTVQPAQGPSAQRPSAQRPSAESVHALRIDVIGVIAAHDGITIDHVRQVC